MEHLDIDVDIDASKYIRIPLDFFSMSEIKELKNQNKPDKLIVAWLKLVLFAARLDNGGKIQVKGTLSKKTNIFFSNNHIYLPSIAFVMGISEEQEFAKKAVEIFLELGLLGMNNNPKEPYFFIKNWETYKFLKPGKKTEWTKEKVEGVLKENDYNFSKAARTIGIAKQYISFLAKKFGIEKPAK